MTKKRGEGNGGGTKMLCPNCGSTVGFTTERRPNGDTECHYCGHKNSTAAFYKSPPEPSTTDAELAPPMSNEELAGLYARTHHGDYDELKAAALWGLRARDAEVAELKALLHDEAKDYAETIMKLCEECGVESIQDIGPKITRLQEKLAESERLRKVYEDTAEKLAEKVVRYQEALSTAEYQLQCDRDRISQVDAAFAEGISENLSVIREALASRSPAEEAGLGEGEK